MSDLPLEPRSSFIGSREDWEHLAGQHGLLCNVIVWWRGRHTVLLVARTRDDLPVPSGRLSAFRRAAEANAPIGCSVTVVSVG